jgi:two-component sensor histidine kinase
MIGASVQARADEIADISLELPPEPKSVPRARSAVSELAASAGADVRAVALAVSEAVGNAVVHAFRDRDRGRILVRAATRGRVLVVTVKDDGVGMTPDFESPGLGVGAALISRLADETEIRSSDEGTTLRMTFPASADPTPGDARR